MARVSSIILLIILSMAAISCTHGLSDEGYSWLPYEENDELVFRSDEGEKQTIIVKSVNKKTSNIDPLALFPKKQEVITVFGESVSNQYESSQSSEEFMLLRISAFSKGRENIWFSWNKPDLQIYGSTGIELSDLKQRRTDKIRIALGEIEVYELESSDRVFVNRSNFVKKFYWSKDLGYVKFELNTGEIWTLVERIRE